MFSKNFNRISGSKPGREESPLAILRVLFVHFQASAVKYVKNVNMYMGIQAENVVMREARIYPPTWVLAKRIRHANGAIPPASQRLFATNIFTYRAVIINQLDTKRTVNRFIVKHFISKLIYCWPSSGSFDRETRSLLQQTGSADEVFQLMARLVTFTNQGAWSSKCSSGVTVVT